MRVDTLAFRCVSSQGDPQSFGPAAGLSNEERPAGAAWGVHSWKAERTRYLTALGGARNIGVRSLILVVVQAGDLHCPQVDSFDRMDCLRPEAAIALAPSR